MALKIIPQTDLKRFYPPLCRLPYIEEYTRFANKLFHQLRSKYHSDLFPDELEKIAIDLTFYFEDVLADVGIWRAFTDKMKAMYGRYLPFYDVDENNYYRDEPNFDDVRFIVWNALTVLRDDALVHPESPILFNIAQDAYDMMDEAFEQMPVNDELKAFFSQAAFMGDFYSMRNLLTWIVFDCWLTSDGGAYEALEDNLEKLIRISTISDPPLTYIYAFKCNLSCSWKVGPLALDAKEWLAAILRHNGHPYGARDLDAMEQREIMYYRVKNVSRKAVTLVGVDDKEISVDYDHNEITKEYAQDNKSGGGEFIRFRGKWHLNGIMSWNTSLEKFDKEREQWLQKQRLGVPNYEKLVKENGGSLLFYFKDIDEMIDFLDKKMELKEVQKQKINTPQDLWDCTWTLFLPAADKGFDSYPDIADCIKDDDNPFYDANIANEQANAMAFNISSDLLCYLVEHDLLPDVRFLSPVDEERGRELLHANFDFLVRTKYRQHF